MTNDEVTEKLQFARRRSDDIKSMIANKTLGELHHDRQQLIQEFFFHAVGAFDRVAHLVNERRSLGLDLEDVTITAVATQLPPADQFVIAFRSLHVNTRRKPLPADPYSDDGLLFRLYNNRHQVTHRGRNPFHFTLSGPTFFLLDPREPPNGTRSRVAIADDMDQMLDLAVRRCNGTLALI